MTARIIILLYLQPNKKGTVKYESVNYAVTILKSGTQEAIEKKLEVVVIPAK